MARIIERRPREEMLLLRRRVRPRHPLPLQTLDGLSLKKIGKAISKAVKPKNLLKTAAVAAVAYGGYKLATSSGGQQVLSKIGSGLMKAGGAAVKVAPQLATSYLNMKAAGQPAAPGLSEPGLMPDGYDLAPAGYPLTPEGYPYELAPQASRPASSMPGWVIPAALGAGLLLVLTLRK